MKRSRPLALCLLLATQCGDDTSPAGNATSGSTAGASSTAADPSGTGGGPATSNTPDSTADSATTSTEGSSTQAADASTGTPSDECGRSPEALSACVDVAAYNGDVAFIAQPRPPGSPHWQAVQDLCADRLEQYGFAVQRMTYRTGVNVVGTRAGQSKAAPHVMIGAHYDHIADCPGADDNASGVAAALEAARVLSMGSFANQLIVACWDEEEAGLLGAEAFATAARGERIPISVYYNFEMLGFASSAPDTQSIPDGFELAFPDQVAEIEANEFRGDFLFMVGDEMTGAAIAALRSHAERVGLPVIAIELTASQKNSPLFGALQRSDHAPFWQADLPALFVSDTAEFRNPRYHCTAGADTPDSLVPAFSEMVIKTIVGAAAESLVLTDA